ncbi:MAG: hypothetical protein KTR32_23810 [Granulosicoccus sp.]|nr:hypothetical protein [Granulosicoccus sp.]
MVLVYWLTPDSSAFRTPSFYQSNPGNQTLAIKPWQSNSGNQTLAIKPWQSNSGNQTLATKHWQSNTGFRGPEL